MSNKSAKDDEKDGEKKKPAPAPRRDGIASRTESHNAVRRAGGTPRQAIRAYCAGNRWLTENAKAVGNW